MKTTNIISQGFVYWAFLTFVMWCNQHPHSSLSKSRRQTSIDTLSFGKKTKFSSKTSSCHSYYVQETATYKQEIPNIELYNITNSDI